MCLGICIIEWIINLKYQNHSITLHNRASTASSLSSFIINEPLNIIIDALQAGYRACQVVVHHQVIRGQAGERVQRRGALRPASPHAYCGSKDLISFIIDYWLYKLINKYLSGHAAEDCKWSFVLEIGLGVLAIASLL